MSRRRELGVPGALPSVTFPTTLIGVTVVPPHRWDSEAK